MSTATAAPVHIATSRVGREPRATSRPLSAIVDATPDSRDRMIDFLRVASMLVVALGHWLMAVVTVEGGKLHGDNLLGMVPGLWLATWILQVMPIFFFVGGFSNSVTLDAYARRDATYAEFMRSRTERMLQPVLVLLGVWTVVALTLQTGGMGGPMLRSATKVVTQPLWFIAVYLGVTALAPVTLNLHRRYGVRVLAVLAGSAVLVDGSRIGAGWTVVASLNLLFVWCFAHQLGYFYADGSLSRLPRRVVVGALVGGLAALVVLTQVGPYPGSMVGMPGAQLSNMAPPTICLLAVTVWQIAAILLLRRRLSLWLQQPKAWRTVIAASSVMMTVFCWHLTALIIVVATVHLAGFTLPAVGTLGWWLLRPLWFGALIGVLAGLVALFGRCERPPATSAPGGTTRAAIGGAVLLIVALGGFAVTGLVPLTAPATLIAWKMTPLACGACLVAGLALTNRNPEVTP